MNLIIDCLVYHEGHEEHEEVEFFMAFMNFMVNFRSANNNECHLFTGIGLREHEDDK